MKEFQSILEQGKNLNKKAIRESGNPILNTNFDFMRQAVKQTQTVPLSVLQTRFLRRKKKNKAETTDLWAPYNVLNNTVIIKHFV